ncbi:cob(I)yrinic acid a,c-diamide adenosyltransferase [Sedimentibacter sp. MB31-C6]|uniref:cob(I)yrinic acid a,c-diamide adenosyltransferase n=1 Tax=Sedimentibacter sp. MB31-C6 TaxID=3109366 RepID=UPI002DDD3BEB|nr:cob(I)yrinic acid a,c-diamide adenosyltransferase [Sedimentibacter sp. MB36-C1]WSI02846.1 cob(I)yrinic acid a,c-diamide adenosyltransferase [Sedimentibacter sp. MB36-C1]
MGYVHVYTGNGKGKTTAALGLSLRAVCAGKRVFFGQFIKGMEYSELKCTEFMNNFEIEQFGRRCFIYEAPTEEDITAFKLFNVEDALAAIKDRSENVEVIITGRYAPEEIISIADLVTEMKEIKHYYSKGIEAREGIEF